jgi:cell division protein FtsL
VSEQASGIKEQIFATAGQALDAGLFWRGNLASAVKRRDFKGTFWGVTALSAVLFFYVWLHMQAVKIGYEVQGLKKEKQELTNQYYFLKYRMHDVDSLSHVEKVAREQLGMVTPKEDQVVILDDRGGSVPRWLSFWTSAMKRLDPP